MARKQNKVFIYFSYSAVTTFCAGNKRHYACLSLRGPGQPLLVLVSV